MNAVFTATYTMLAVATVLLVVRLVRGPTVHDRVTALDTLVVVLLSGFAVDAAARGEGGNVTLLMAVALVGFLSTVAVVRLLPGDKQ